MKSRGTLIFSAIFVLAAFAAAVLPETAPPGDKESIIIQTMMRNLERFHYQPMDIDNDFSARAYDFYLNDIDGARLFFTTEDLGKFGVHKFNIDDQIAAGSYEFFDLTQERWKASMDKTQEWYRDILSKPFDVTKGSEIKMRDDDSGWSRSDKELRQYWEDYMKRDVISQIVSKQEEYKKAVENRAKIGSSACAKPSQVHVVAST